MCGVELGVSWRCGVTSWIAVKSALDLVKIQHMTICSSNQHLIFLTHPCSHTAQRPFDSSVKEICINRPFQIQIKGIPPKNLVLELHKYLLFFYIFKYMCNLSLSVTIANKTMTFCPKILFYFPFFSLLASKGSVHNKVIDTS